MTARARGSQHRSRPQPQWCSAVGQFMLGGRYSIRLLQREPLVARGLVAWVTRRLPAAGLGRNPKMGRRDDGDRLGSHRFRDQERSRSAIDALGHRFQARLREQLAKLLGRGMMNLALYARDTDVVDEPAPRAV